MRIAISLLFGLTACMPAGSDSPGGETEPAPRSLAPDSEQPTLVDSQPITGVIGFDAIEGGCAYVETDDGTRYEVIWPDGWELRGNELREPGGAVVAQAGDQVTVHGHEAEEVASICQIGPMFQATDVETEQ